MRFTFFVFALLAAASPIGGKLFHTDKSPSGRILADHYFFEPSDPHWETPLTQIWLHDAQGKIPPSLLFEHHRSADILFSPNEKWIAISDNSLSDFADVRLFRRTRDLKYDEEIKADPGNKCWALSDRISGRPMSSKFDHRYVYAVRWAPDSRAVLLKAL